MVPPLPHPLHSLPKWKQALSLSECDCISAKALTLVPTDLSNRGRCIPNFLLYSIIVFLNSYCVQMTTLLCLNGILLLLSTAGSKGGTDYSFARDKFEPSSATFLHRHDGSHISVSCLSGTGTRTWKCVISFITIHDTPCCIIGINSTPMGFICLLLLWCRLWRLFQQVNACPYFCSVRQLQMLTLALFEQIYDWSSSKPITWSI